MRKVLVSAMTLSGVEGEYAQVLRSAGFELIYPARPVQLVESEMPEALEGIYATLAGSEPYTRKVLNGAPGLRVIARMGVGYDAVDLAAATDHGIAVTFTPGTNHDAVAELAFALILGLTKDLVSQHMGTRALKWPRRTNLPLRGRTLGIAGLGRIGKSVALLGEAFKMKLMAYEPFPDQAFAQKHKVALVPFEKLLAESDFLSLHSPFTPESKHMINKSTLALMKPTAFLINTARGGLVCEADLIEALQNKKLAGAGLDVFEKEPPLASPLFHMDNVLVTPHAAGVDFQSRDDMAMSAAVSIVKLYKGEWPEELIVNKDVKAKFKP
jgi:D-3-phosphoglycerate dehydrogenase / 2-oxoglutarate reductase